MKKLLPLILTAALAGCQSANLPPLTFSELSNLDPTINSKKYNVRRPINEKSIAGYFKTLKFISDKKSHGYEFFQSPKKTTKLQRGDCDDFAPFGAFFVEKYLGLPPQRLAIRGIVPGKKQQGHYATFLQKQTPEGMMYGAIDRGFWTDYHLKIEKVVEKVARNISMSPTNDFWVENLNEIYDKKGIDWRTTDKNLWDYNE